MKDLLTHVSRTTSRGVKKEGGGAERNSGGEGGLGGGGVPRAVHACFPPGQLFGVLAGRNGRESEGNAGQMKKREEEKPLYSWRSLKSKQTEILKAERAQTKLTAMTSGSPLGIKDGVGAPPGHCDVLPGRRSDILTA